MPKLYVGFQQNGVRKASGSITTLREKVREFPETVWSIFKYTFQPGVETLVVLAEGDYQKWGAPEYLEHWRTNAQGQVRKFDPTKTVLA